MLKKTFRFVVPFASGTLVLLFLPNGPLPGLIRGEAAQQQAAPAAGITSGAAMRNLIAVSTNNGLLIFNRTDNGNVKPRAIIKGVGGKFRLIRRRAGSWESQTMTRQKFKV